MSLDSLESQVLATLLAELPAAVTAENATHADGVAIPTVQTYGRGAPPVDLEVKASNLPLVSVACLSDQALHDQPEDSASLGDWGALIERLVVIVGMTVGASVLEAHVRALRLVAALKAVGRAHVADRMHGETLYWPYDCEVDVNPAVQLPSKQYLTVFALAYPRVRVIE